MDDYDWCARAGYAFRNRDYLSQALTHCSAVGEHNERLEFLGDSVLGFIITDWLYEQFSQYSESHLSRLRAHLVCTARLAEIAKCLKLENHLILGDSARHMRASDSVLADAVEALLAAIYLDSKDLSVVRSRILDWFEPCLWEIKANPILPKDPKTRLQEYLQGEGLALATYDVVHRWGSAHAPKFRVRCVALQLEAIAEGSSIKQAEQEAAELILVRLVK